MPENATMNKPVKLNDIVEGMEFSSEESASYLDRTTGEVVHVDNTLFGAAEDGDEPDHMADWEREEYETTCLIAADDAGRFVSLPDQFDIDEYRKLGYTGLDADVLVKMRIHRVTPSFIREIHGVGVKTATVDQLVRMRIHRVDAEFIRQLQADGYRDLTVSDVLDIAIRGPRFARRKGA